MNLKVERGKSTENSTPGQILVDGIYHSYCLEPPAGGFDQTIVWPELQPIRHYDRIPAGTYYLELHLSARLGYEVLWIRNGTPEFDDRKFYFHIGNWCQNGTGSPIDRRTGRHQCDTLGCILPGCERGIDAVYHSGEAFSGLMDRVGPHLRAGEKVPVDIIDG